MVSWQQSMVAQNDSSGLQVGQDRSLRIPAPTINSSDTVRTLAGRTCRLSSLIVSIVSRLTIKRNCE